MSRHFAASFAIVGTLVLARAGAASAGGLVNLPHINIPRPQISIPTPHPSVPTPHLNIPQPQISVVTPRLSSPKLTTHNLVNFPKGTTHANNGSGSNAGGYRRSFVRVLTQGSGTDSSSGSTSAMPVSNTGGSAGSPSYLTEGKANASATFRCRSKGGVSNCPG
jgi:hypothetical protein